MTRFSFGKNWQDFSRLALNEEKLEQARQGFFRLIDSQDLIGKKFLDIGFGQGVSMFIAAESGAVVSGIDIDEDNICAVEATAEWFKGLGNKPVFRVGSILNDADLVSLKEEGPFDIVHSWGVLHHTGDMWQAIDNSLNLVAGGGRLIISIYNTHWSSAIWHKIKWFYNVLPSFLRRLMVYLFYPIILLAKFIVTGKNPFEKERGMDFYYDVVDWVGGFPYEYATADEIIKFVELKGFKLEKLFPASVPTGCNEFVFRKV